MPPGKSGSWWESRENKDATYTISLQLYERAFDSDFTKMALDENMSETLEPVPSPVGTIAMPSDATTNDLMLKLDTLVGDFDPSSIADQQFSDGHFRVEDFKARCLEVGGYDVESCGQKCTEYMGNGSGDGSVVKLIIMTDAALNPLAAAAARASQLAALKKGSFMDPVKAPAQGLFDSFFRCCAVR